MRTADLRRPRRRVKLTTLVDRLAVMQDRIIADADALDVSANIAQIGGLSSLASVLRNAAASMRSTALWLHQATENTGTQLASTE